MLVALLLFLLYFFAFVGAGNLFNKYIIRDESASLYSAFFVGVIVLTTFVNILHFFSPIDRIITLFIFLPGLAMFRRMTDLFVKLHQVNLIRLIYITVVVSFALFFVSQPVTIYDTYIYHDQAIQWFTNYPLIPGIANLHGRFGFNNSLFVLFSTQPQFTESRYYVLHGLFFVMIILWLSDLFVNAKDWYKRAAIVTVISLLVPFSQEYLSSPSANYHVVIFALAALLSQTPVSDDKSSSSFPLLFGAFIPTLKMSFALFAFMIFLGSFILQINKRKLNGRVLSFAILIGLVWLTRNIVITGQLLYPMEPIYSEYFDHRVSRNQIKEEIVGIKGWAIHPGKDYREYYHATSGTLKWVPEWYEKRFNHTYSRFPLLGKISIRYFVFFTIFALIIYLYYWFRERKINYGFIIISGLFLNSIYWFLNAPSWDFGSWVFILLLFSALYWTSFSKWVAVLVGILFLFTVPYKSIEIIRSLIKISDLPGNFISKPRGMEDVFLKTESRSFGFVTDTIFNSDKSAIFLINRPVIGDQCSGNVFPCVPYEVNNVEMIGNEITKGLRLKSH